MKFTSNQLSTNERAYSLAVRSPLFTDKGWQNAVNTGNKDVYLSTMLDVDKLPQQSYLETKYFDFNKWDEDTKLFAIQNEMYADNTEKKLRKNLYYGDAGKILNRELLDKDSAEYRNSLNSLNNVELTDKEYNDYLLKQHGDIYYEEWLTEQKRIAKEQHSFMTQLGADIVSIGASLYEGVGNALYDLTVGLPNFIDAMAKGIFTDLSIDEALLESFEGYADQKAYYIGSNAIDEFRSKYSSFMDVNGEWTRTGSLIASVCESIGYAVTTSLMPTPKGLTYYGAMAIGEIGEIYSDENNALVSKGAFRVLTNVAIKSALQYAVDVGVGHFVGNTKMGALRKGGKVSAVASNKFAAYGAGVLIEGGTEVLQELSDTFVNNCYALFDKNDQFYTKLDGQTLIDSFFAGVISEGTMRGFDNITSAIVKNKELNVSLAEDEVYAKLSTDTDKKAYKKGLKQFMDAYYELSNKDLKTVKGYASDLRLMLYNGFSALSSYYQTIGPERAAKAEALLTKLNDAQIVNNKKSKHAEHVKIDGKFYDAADVNVSFANAMMSMYKQASHDAVKKRKSKRKIDTVKNATEAGVISAEKPITGILNPNTNTIENANGEPVKLTDHQEKIARDLFDTGLNVALTADRTSKVVDDTIFVHKNDLNDSAATVLRDAATEAIIDNILADLDKIVVKELTAAFNVIDKNSTLKLSEKLTHALLDPDQKVMNMLMPRASSQIFKFFSQIGEIVVNVADKSETLALKQHMYSVLNKIYNNVGPTLITYAINNPYVPVSDIDLLNAKQRKYVYNHRAPYSVRERIIEGTATEADKKMIRSKINYLVADKSIKTKLQEFCFSDKPNERERGLVQLDKAYEHIYFGKHNDEIYPRKNDIRSNALYSFLREKHTTMSALKQLARDGKSAAIISQFKAFTDNQYSLDFSKNDLRVIENTPLDYGPTAHFLRNEFNSRLSGSLVDAYPTVNDTHKERVRELKYQLVNKKLNLVQQSFLTLSDIVEYPDLYLSDEIKNELIDDGQTINKYNVLRYINSKLPDDIMATIDPRGRVVIRPTADVISRLSDEFRENAKSGNKVILSKYMNAAIRNGGRYSVPLSILAPNLELDLSDVPVVFTTFKSNQRGVYSFTKNEIRIYVNNLFSDAALVNTLAHELMHAVSDRLDYGNTSYIVTADEITDEVIKDMKKHMAVADKKEASRILYLAMQDELVARGVGNNYGITIYEDLLNTRGDKSNLYILMPWGEYYTFITINGESKLVVANDTQKTTNFKSTEARYVTSKQLQGAQDYHTVTKDEYDAAVKTISNYEKALALAKVTNAVAKNISKITGVSKDVAQQMIDKTFKKSKDAVWTNAVNARAWYTSQKARAMRKDVRITRGDIYDYAVIGPEIAKGTMAEYYLGRGKYLMTPPKFKTGWTNFLLNADEKQLEPAIAEGIKNQQWSAMDLYQYIRQGLPINDYTFKMLMKYVFPNNPINSIDTLDDFNAHADELYDLLQAVDSSKFSYIMTKPLKTTAPKDIIAVLSSKPEIMSIKKDIKTHLTYTEGYVDELGVEHDKTRKQDVDVGQLRLQLLTKFDGTLDSLLRLLNTARIQSEYGYATRGKKTISTDEWIDGRKGEGGATRGDLLEDTSAEKDYERVFKSKRDQYIEDITAYYTQVIGKKVFSAMEAKQTYIVVEKRKYDITKRESVAKLLSNYRKMLASKSNEELKRAWIKLGFLAESTTPEELDNTVEKIKTARETKVVRTHYQAMRRIRQQNNDNFRKKRLVNKMTYDYLSDDVKKYVSNETYELDVSKINKLSTEQIDSLADRMRDDFANIRRISRMGVDAEKLRDKNKILKAQQTEIKTNNKKLKNVGKTNVKITNNKPVYVTTLANTTFVVNSDAKCPEILQRLLGQSFNTTNASTTKFLTEENERHFEISAKIFYDENAEILSSLTEEDVQSIIDFYNGSVIYSEIDAETLKRLEAFEIMLFAYFIEQNNVGAINLTDAQITSMKDLLKFTVTDAATKLAIWGKVHHKLNPGKYIAEALYRRYDLAVSEDDINELNSLMYPSDGKVDEDALSKKIKIIYSKAINDAEQRYKHFRAYTMANSIVKYMKGMLLSNPKMFLRNNMSNGALALEYKFGLALGNVIAKTIKKDKLATGQSGFYKVSLDANDSNDKIIMDFCKTLIDDSGFMTLIANGITKYDVVRLRKRGAEGREILTEMMMNNLIKSVLNGQKLNQETQSSIKKCLTAISTVWTKYVTTLNSDSPFIKRAFKKYLGQYIKANNIPVGDIDWTTISLEEGKNVKLPLSILSNEKMLDAVVKTWTLANYDYMHRGNFMSDFTSWLQNRPNGKWLKVGFDLISPFVVSGTNWMLDMLDTSPVGLIKNIIKLKKLDGYVTNLEMKLAKGERIPYAPEFAQMVITRQIGRGVLHTLLLILGLIAGKLGVFTYDDDDNTTSLDLFGYKFNFDQVSSLSHFSIGATITSMFESDEAVWDILGNAVEYTFDDFFMTSICNDIRNSESLLDFGAKRVLNIMTSFVPNLYKSVLQATRNEKYKYDKGMLGTLEYYAYSILPGNLFNLPKRIDPYTGELEVKYSDNTLFHIYSLFSPIPLKTVTPSPVEATFISLNMGLGELSGEYDFGKLNRDTLNQYYGKLNNKLLQQCIHNERKYAVEDTNGKLKQLYFKDMSDKQKKNVLTRIKNQNAELAKIYTWTKAGHKYYCTTEKRNELRKLGITDNVYVKTAKKEGFVN